MGDTFFARRVLQSVVSMLAAGLLLAGSPPIVFRAFVASWPTWHDGSARILDSTSSVASQTVAAAAFAGRQATPTVKLYVLDCGTLEGADPTRYRLKTEEVATLRMSVACFL